MPKAGTMYRVQPLRKREPRQTCSHYESENQFHGVANSFARTKVLAQPQRTWEPCIECNQDKNGNQDDCV